MIVACHLVALTCLVGAQGAPQGALTGAPFAHTAAAGDTLAMLAVRFGVEVNVLAGANGLQPQHRLAAGDSITVNNVHIVPQVAAEGVVINVPQRMLFYFQGGQLVARYPVSVGRPGWVTPHGQFKVARKEENPTWEVPKSIQEEMRRDARDVRTTVGPSPQNPLGKHWIGLDKPGYGIHGTNNPSSIYQFRTHGCIRLHPDDVKDLFHRVQIGTPVMVIYEPVLLARIGDVVYLEVNRDIYRWRGDLMAAVRALAAAAQVESQIDWVQAATVVRSQQGIATPLAAPTQATGPR